MILIVREKELSHLEQLGNYQDAAILAFVLAKKAQKADDDKEATRLGRKCLELLKKYPTDTMEECASPYISVADVLIPGFFHAETVRRELAPLNL